MQETAPVAMSYQKSSSSIEKVEKKGWDSERIFKWINLVIFAVLLYCLKGFLEFREYCAIKGYYAMSMESFKLCGIGFVFAFIGKYSYFYFMEKKVEAFVHPRYVGEERVRKGQFVLKLSYDSCFYLFMTVVAYVLFREQYWFPAMAGGCGACEHMYRQYPNWPAEKRTQLQVFFTFQLGVHIFSVFQMAVFKRKTERKFYEYLLHHSVAATLILFSTMSNQVTAGTMTLIVHDMSDIFLAAGRGYFETVFKQNKYITGFLISSLLFSWIYCRIIMFPFCMLANVYINRPLPSSEWYMISFEYNYLLATAFVLFGMHLYWTYYIIKSGLKSLTKKEVINIHEREKVKN